MLTAPQFSPARLAAVRARIEAAARSAGRDPAEVRLLAVSKQQPADVVRAAAEAGQREFGENYLQEARAKLASLRDLSLSWHFIGQLQGNKTREVAEDFQWVHTLDRGRIAQRLNDQRPHHAGPLDVLLQVKLAEEAGKGGVSPDEIDSLAEIVAGLPRLRLRGLMCIPPPETEVERQRAWFRRTRELADDLNRRGHSLDTLSMGMSADLEAAVAEGATIVRIGTAVFGPRD
ncbi:MAG: YggS family pyridoxal phosphate-dependent enzyme [Gammaproteobacteria bacterium]|nr:YggS family pyridoxal phosphate-dependent enzyme [Gammaproteobacteria bacterium]